MKDIVRRLVLGVLSGAALACTESGGDAGSESAGDRSDAADGTTSHDSEGDSASGASADASSGDTDGDESGSSETGGNDNDNDNDGDGDGDGGGLPSIDELPDCGWTGQQIAPKHRVDGVGDTNGDGALEILMHPQNGGIASYSLAQFPGPTISTPITAPDWFNAAWLIHVDDDNHIDFLAYDGTLHWAKGDGTGEFGAIFPVTTPPHGVVFRAVEVAESPRQLVLGRLVGRLEDGVITDFASEPLITRPHLSGVATLSRATSDPLVAASGFAQSSDHDLKIWRASPQNALTLVAEFEVSSSSTDLFLGDINNDGSPDLLASDDIDAPDESSPILRSLGRPKSHALGEPDSNFLPLSVAAEIPWFSGHRRRMTVLDANDDEFPDLAVWGAVEGRWATVLLENDSTGTFVNPCTLALDHKLRFAADFDGDGRVDLAGNDPEGNAWVFTRPDE